MLFRSLLSTLSPWPCYCSPSLPGHVIDLGVSSALVDTPRVSLFPGPSYCSPSLPGHGMDLDVSSFMETYGPKTRWPGRDLDVSSALAGSKSDLEHPIPPSGPGRHLCTPARRVTMVTVDGFPLFPKVNTGSTLPVNILCSPALWR